MIFVYPSRHCPATQTTDTDCAAAPQMSTTKSWKREIFSAPTAEVQRSGSKTRRLESMSSSYREGETVVVVRWRGGAQSAVLDNATSLKWIFGL